MLMGVGRYYVYVGVMTKLMRNPGGVGGVDGWVNNMQSQTPKSKLLIFFGKIVSFFTHGIPTLWQS